jgi:hypothetical protein
MTFLFRIIFLCFLVLHVTCNTIGWQDVCKFSKDVHTCYVWKNNIAPFNDISNYLSSTSVCAHNCVLYLMPFQETCNNIIECQGINNNFSATTIIHNLPRTVSILGENTQIVGFGNNVAIVGMESFDTNNDCTMFKIYSKNVKFHQIQFYLTNTCAKSATSLKTDHILERTRIPLLFYEGGNVELLSITSNAVISTVMFIGSILERTTLQLTAKNVSMSSKIIDQLPNYSYPIIILNMNLTNLQCEMMENDIFYYSDSFVEKDKKNNCSTFFNISEAYFGTQFDPIECPIRLAPVQQKKCAKQTHLHLSGILGIVIVSLIGIVQLFFVQFTKAGHFLKKSTLRC